MGDKKKKDGKRLECLETHGVSITRFIKEFLGIEDDALLRSDLTHQVLAELFPYLKRTSFEHILDNPNVVYSGSVVLVKDKLGNYIPYIVTGLLEKLEEQGINYVMSEADWGDGTPENWDQTERINYDLEALSTYQLTQLMYIYKASGEHNNYLKVRNELTSREDSSRANRLSKQKALRRSAKKIKDDEYY